MANNSSYDLGRPLRALDAWDCRLSAPATPNSEGKEPFLFVDFRYHKVDGNHVKVRDIKLGVNLRRSGREGKIDFFPTISQFKAICLVIEDAALGRLPGDLFKLESMSTFMFGKKLDRPETEVMVVVGKDGEGVFIGVSMKGRDNVKFYFTPPKMTQIRAASGEVITNGYASELFARVRADIWWDHVNSQLKAGYLSDKELQDAKDENKRKNQQAFSQRQGGGGGNDWGNKGNSGGNAWGGQSQSQPSAPAPSSDGGFDNDVPW